MSDEQKSMEDGQSTANEKTKKINKMTLKEVEQAIEKTKKHQGGLFSRYAKELLERQKALTN